jgi:hypothetical protein
VLKTKLYQVSFEYAHFKHLPNCIVQSRFRVQAVSARQAVEKALKREEMPERLLQILTTELPSNEAQR